MMKLYKVFPFILLLISFFSFSSCTIHYTESYAVSMEILTLPSNLTYAVNEEINITGLTVAITYISGKVLTVTPGLDMIEYDTSKLGKSTVRVFFEKVSTTYDINIVEYRDNIVLVEIEKMTVNSENFVKLSVKIPKETVLSNFHINFVYDKANFRFDSVLESENGMLSNHVADIATLDFISVKTENSNSATTLIVFRLLALTNATIVPNFKTMSAYKIINADYETQSVALEYIFTYLN